MNALLGKITRIERQGASPAGTACEVRFRAACQLPERIAPPEWLKEQSLTLQRTVQDARELGYPGESIVLTPAESERWLVPLTVTPSIAYGELPATLQLRLRWWKEEKLPEFTVRANGRAYTASFTREGDGGVATVDAATFFSSPPPRLPVTFEVTCDKLMALATVLPVGEPTHARIQIDGGERHRLENDWYAIDIVGREGGGAIAALVEKGRGVDHFRAPEGLIQQPFENGGLIDRFRTDWHWSEQMDRVAMTCAGARREAGAIRLRLEGVIDDGQNLRSTVAYTLLDAAPLCVVERDYQFLPEKKEGKEKEKEEKPKEPIDDMKALSLGVRIAARAERDGDGGSRVLCVEGDHFAPLRPAETGEWFGCHYWRVADGWALVEHPRRREYQLCLFDRSAPPHPETGLEAHALHFQPLWPFRPVRPGETVGVAYAIAAGECAGAAVAGAWVACRVPTPGGGMRCAVVARLRDPAGCPEVTVSLGDEQQTARTQSVLLPGVGAVRSAVATFPKGTMDAPFAVIVAGISGDGRL